MHCPFCRYDETKVVDSRTSQPHAIRRRRECLGCERRFTTYEKIEESPLRVIKKDGCLLYTSPSPRDGLLSRMPSSA